MPFPKLFKIKQCLWQCRCLLGGGSFCARLGASTCLLSNLSSLFFDVSQKTLVLKITLIPLLPRAPFGFKLLCYESISFNLQRLWQFCGKYLARMKEDYIDNVLICLEVFLTVENTENATRFEVESFIPTPPDGLVGYRYIFRSRSENSPEIHVFLGTGISFVDVRQSCTTYDVVSLAIDADGANISDASSVSTIETGKFSCTGRGYTKKKPCPRCQFHTVSYWSM